MSKASDRNFHFREMRGDYSTRINANGDYKHLAHSPVLYVGFIAQTQKVYERLAAFKKLPFLTIDQKAEFQKLLSDYGARQHLLRKASRLAFEAVFLKVAESMLPVQHFMAIHRDAEEMWKQTTFNSKHIYDLKAANKAARKIGSKRYYKKLANCKKNENMKVAPEDYSI